MIRCPSCKRELDHILAVYEVSGWKYYSVELVESDKGVEEGKVSGEEFEPDDENFLCYECPYCGEHIDDLTELIVE